MSVAFIVQDTAYEIGSAPFLNCFFSTICVRLEMRAWSSRFPVLMNSLHRGVLPAKEAGAALRELDAIEAELALLPPSAVVWDLEDPSAGPPWGASISPTITSMANYFVTSDGRGLVGVLRRALCQSQEFGVSVTIE